MSSPGLRCITSLTLLRTLCQFREKACRSRPGTARIRGTSDDIHRASTILNLPVDEYVQTATPVASDGIARSPTLRVSPATVRSAMSQFTEAGYIAPPRLRWRCPL